MEAQKERDKGSEKENKGQKVVKQERRGAKRGGGGREEGEEEREMRNDKGGLIEKQATGNDRMLKTLTSFSLIPMTDKRGWDSPKAIK